MPESQRRIRFLRSQPQLEGEHTGQIISGFMSPTGYIEVKVEGDDGKIVHVHVTDIEWIFA